jgi:hypothetical protein
MALGGVGQRAVRPGPNLPPGTIDPWRREAATLFHPGATMDRIDTDPKDQASATAEDGVLRAGFRSGSLLRTPRAPVAEGAREPETDAAPASEQRP